MNRLLKTKKIGIIGAGKMSQAIIGSLMDSGNVSPENILVSSRTEGKLEKLKQKWQVQIEKRNDLVAEKSEILLLAVKPQDLPEVAESLFSTLNSQHVVLSILAGVNLKVLSGFFPRGTSLVRLMPNISLSVGKGICAYCLKEKRPFLDEVVEFIFSHGSKIMKMEDEEKMNAFTVAASSGVGFVLEIMLYWVEWLEGYGYSSEEARKVALHLFSGVGYLLDSSEKSLEHLQEEVSSKKGVTQEGLKAMRAMELEKVLRISFEKALLKNSQLNKFN